MRPSRRHLEWKRTPVISYSQAPQNKLSLINGRSTVSVMYAQYVSSAPLFSDGKKFSFPFFLFPLAIRLPSWLLFIQPLLWRFLRRLSSFITEYWKSIEIILHSSYARIEMWADLTLSFYSELFNLLIQSHLTGFTLLVFMVVMNE